jgi:hypothetical protein
VLSARRLLFAVAAIATGQAMLPAHGEAREESVKAAFLPKFARYVEWPAAARPAGREPIRLCVVGSDAFGRVLDDSAAQESVSGRPVEIRRMADAEGAAGCHLAFVRGTTPEDTSRLLAALGEQPILTVTDAGAGQPRGMVHFVVARGRVRFFVDEAAAARRGLLISSRLLRLAIGVRQRRS